MTVNIIGGTETISVIIATPASSAFIRATADGSADYTITTAQQVTLGQLTANMVVNLPAPTATNQPITILNKNTSGFHWSFGGQAVNDFSGNPVVNLQNTSIYILSPNGTSYDIIN